MRIFDDDANSSMEIALIDAFVCAIYQSNELFTLDLNDSKEIENGDAFGFQMKIFDMHFASILIKSGKSNEFLLLKIGFASLLYIVAMFNIQPMI